MSNFQSAFELYVEGSDTASLTNRSQMSALQAEQSESQQSSNSEIDPNVGKSKYQTRSRSASISISNSSDVTTNGNSNKSELSKLGHFHMVTRRTSSKKSTGENEDHAKSSQTKCTDFFRVCKPEHLPNTGVKKYPVMLKLGDEKQQGIIGETKSRWMTSRVHDLRRRYKQTRLVVKITKKKFCQLKCEEADVETKKNPDRFTNKITESQDGSVPGNEVEQEASVGSADDEASRLTNDDGLTSDSQNYSKSKVLKSSWNGINVGMKSDILLTRSMARKYDEKQERLQMDDLMMQDSDQKTSESEQRPKRNIIPKKQDDTSGLSWREETELKRALYASLQKRQRLDGKFADEDSCVSSSVCSVENQDKRHQRSRQQSFESSSQNKGFDDLWTTQSNIGKLAFCQSEKHMYTSTTSSISGGSVKNSGPNYRSHEGINNFDNIIPRLNQVRAQRKFAHGSRPDSPNLALRKKVFKRHHAAKKFDVPKKVTTEDFLTFLCLRGTDFLPPHLEYFNYSESESLSSFPNTPSPSASRADTPLVDILPNSNRVSPLTRSFSSPAAACRKIETHKRNCGLAIKINKTPAAPVPSLSKSTELPLHEKDHVTSDPVVLICPQDAKEPLTGTIDVCPIPPKKPRKTIKEEDVKKTLIVKNDIKCSSSDVGDDGKFTCLKTDLRQFDEEGEVLTTSKKENVEEVDLERLHAKESSLDDNVPDEEIAYKEESVVGVSEGRGEVTPLERGSKCEAAEGKESEGGDKGSMEKSRPVTRSRTVALMKEQFQQARMKNGKPEVREAPTKVERKEIPKPAAKVSYSFYNLGFPSGDKVIAADARLNSAGSGRIEAPEKVSNKKAKRRKASRRTIKSRFIQNSKKTVPECLGSVVPDLGNIPIKDDDVEGEDCKTDVQENESSAKKQRYFTRQHKNKESCA